MERDCKYGWVDVRGAMTAYLGVEGKVGFWDIHSL
jgi:hypothetical protein